MTAIFGLALSACAQPGAPPVCTAPLKPAIAIDLYFGRDKPAGGEVTDAEWGAFVTVVFSMLRPPPRSTLTPTLLSCTPLVRSQPERSKRLVVIVFDAPAHKTKVIEIVEAYKQRFGQYSVFRVEQPVCAGL
jgi:hypothetical protein